jgi:ATP-binding cassette subfamily B protein
LTRDDCCGVAAASSLNLESACACAAEVRHEVSRNKKSALRAVLPFVFRHWTHQPGRCVIAGGLIAAAAADVFMPLFAGKLVDAIALTDPAAAKRGAMIAFAAIVALGLAALVARFIGLKAIIPFTLRIMSDVAQNAFVRIQRFSTDWHANSFAGSTVRKITRGMWSLDLLNDTILMALIPSLVVLLGSTILVGWHWPVLGAVIALMTVIYVGMTVALTTNYIAPAAQLSNALDTKVGGTLADALTCNAVVKSFGAERVKTSVSAACSASGATAPTAHGHAICRHGTACRAGVDERDRDRRRPVAVGAGRASPGEVARGDDLFRHSRLSR